MLVRSPGKSQRRAWFTHPGFLLTVFLASAWISIIRPSSLVAAATEAHNSLIVLLDVSGSMKQSDPSCLRYRATDLLVNLLRDQDRFALAEFGTRVNDLTGGFVLLEEGSRTRISKTLERCSQADQYTDIVAALDHALRLASALPQETRLSYPVSVVLLTDGKDDVGEPSGRQVLLQEKAMALSSLGVVVHGVALSRSADRALLRAIADQTGGEVSSVESSQDLLEGFFEVSRVLGKRWNVEERTVLEGTISLNVPPWARRMFLCFLPKNDGSRLTVTTPVKIEEKTHGKCQTIRVETGGLSSLEILVTQPGGRLIVDAEGDLFLQDQIPTTIPKDVPFLCKARILPAQGVDLGKPSFLSNSTVSISWTGARQEKTCFLYDDGDHEDSQPVDGIFSGYCAISGPGKVGYRIRAAAPMSPGLIHGGEVFVRDDPVGFEIPGLIGRYLLAQGTGRLRLQLHNLTDVALKGALRVASSSTQAWTSALDLPPRTSQTFMIHIKPALWRNTGLRASLDLNGIAEAKSVQIQIGPSGPPVIALLLFACALVLSFLFPRRTTQGSILKVEFRENDQERTEFIRIGKDGLPAKLQDLPDPVGRPGRFRARNGLWRRGVIFEPSPELTLQFERKPPKRTRTGFLILKGPVVWKTRGALGEVRYTYRPNS